jgi:type II secretory pathway component PulJ
MIVVAIIGILSPIVAHFIDFHPRVFEEIEQDRQMTEQVRTAMAWMGRDIRSARSVVTKAGPFQMSASGPLILASSEERHQFVVWTVSDEPTQAGALVRIEFDDRQAQDSTNRLVVAAPQARLNLAFKAQPPQSSNVAVRVGLTRTVMDRARSVEVTGLFALRARKP